MNTPLPLTPLRLTPLKKAGLLLALVVFLLDRGTKLLMTHVLELQYYQVYELLPFFDLRWTQNFGVSLGMFTATSLEMRLGLIAMTGAISVAVMVWMLREKAKGDVLALAMVLGGAVGNIWDRISRGYVIDFADLHFGEFRPFLIFNVADAAITIGVLILLARALLLREKPETSGEATDAASDAAADAPATEKA